MTGPTVPPVDPPSWEEARGPHLPDRVTGVPLLAWPFVVLAVVQAAITWQTMSADILRDPATFLTQALLAAIPKIAFSLLGAALFVRHPDAVRTLPMVVAGVSLLAAQQVLGMLYEPLRPLVEALPLAGEDEAIAMLGWSFYGLFSSVVGIVALVYLAHGLDAARRFEGDADRRIAIALAAVALAAVGMSGFIYLRLPAGTILGGPALIGLSLLIVLATLLATIYLTTIALAGRRADEDPPAGWTLAAAYGLVTVVTGTALVVIDAVGPVSIDWLGYASRMATAAAALALLVAFALGLPSTDPVDPDEVGPTFDPPEGTTPGSAGS